MTDNGVQVGTGFSGSIRISGFGLHVIRFSAIANNETRMAVIANLEGVEVIAETNENYGITGYESCAEYEVESARVTCKNGYERSSRIVTPAVTEIADKSVAEKRALYHSAIRRGGNRSSSSTRESAWIRQGAAVNLPYRFRSGVLQYRAYSYGQLPLPSDFNVGQSQRLTNFRWEDRTVTIPGRRAIPAVYAYYCTPSIPSDATNPNSCRGAAIRGVTSYDPSIIATIRTNVSHTPAEREANEQAMRDARIAEQDRVAAENASRAAREAAAEADRLAKERAAQENRERISRETDEAVAIAQEAVAAAERAAALIDDEERAEEARIAQDAVDAARRASEAAQLATTAEEARAQQRIALENQRIAEQALADSIEAKSEEKRMADNEALRLEIERIRKQQDQYDTEFYTGDTARENSQDTKYRIISPKTYQSVNGQQIANIQYESVRFLSPESVSNYVARGYIIETINQNVPTSTSKPYGASVVDRSKVLHNIKSGKFVPSADRKKRVTFDSITKQQKKTFHHYRRVNNRRIIS